MNLFKTDSCLLILHIGILNIVLWNLSTETLRRNHELKTKSKNICLDFDFALLLSSEIVHDNVHRIIIIVLLVCVQSRGLCCASRMFPVPGLLWNVRGCGIYCNWLQCDKIENRYKVLFIPIRNSNYFNWWFNRNSITVEIM